MIDIIRNDEEGYIYTRGMYIYRSPEIIMYIEDNCENVIKNICINIIKERRLRMNENHISSTKEIDIYSYRNDDKEWIGKIKLLPLPYGWRKIETDEWICTNSKYYMVILLQSK